MPLAAHAQTSFLGGELSKTAQGRFDDPAYRTGLNVCLNALPIEQGAWTRRPGSMFGGTTRGGAEGRVVTFNFAQATPYTIEFTDGHMQFRDGIALIDTNDSVVVSSISTANPAVITLASAVTWATGDRGYFTGLGSSCPLLQNRRFTLTKLTTSTFSLADELSGQSIDGSTLGVSGLAATATFNRALDIATPWTAGAWKAMRVVLCDIPISQGTAPGAVMLSDSAPPQVLEVLTEPTATANATFSFSPANIKDGPYLDPFQNGIEANASAKSGVINLTISAPPYDSTKAYTTGDFVSFSSVNYESLIDQNVGNQPNTHPADWKAVSIGTAIGPNGFVGSDVGRLVRLFSEPDIWASTTTYASGAIVSYNPSNTPDATEYYSSLVGSNVGNVPGTDATHWQIAANNPAIWSWGKIVALSNIIDGGLAGSVNVGTMTIRGGLAASFDGVLSKVLANCSCFQESGLGGGTISPSAPFTATVTSYIGKNYSGASAQQIAQVTVYPSSDAGFTDGAITAESFADGVIRVFNIDITNITMNLRAKATAPASSSDGTLLGTMSGISNIAPVTIISSDQATAWNYVWVEIVSSGQVARGDPAGWSVLSGSFENETAQVQFFSPSGTGTSTGVSLEILGPALLYTTPIRTWRLGLFSNTTGWPTVGTWHEGRFVPLGVVNNRIDLSVANDPFNFAPTDQFGNVLDSSAISYPLNSDDTNPVFWAQTDDRGIVIGTQGGEFLVQATTQNLPLSPTNIQAHRVTKYGCANVEPRRANQAIIMVQRFGRKLREFFADVFSGRLTAPHLSKNSFHLTQTFLQEIAYQQEITPNIWARRGDGALVGWAYQRDNMMSSQGPEFIGGHRHTLGSGRIVESICAGASSDGNLDALTMVTNDTNNGIRHVEVLSNIWEEGDDISSAWMLDDAVTPASFTINASAQTLTINGLWHLNGKTATAFVAGIDAGDYAVTNGTMTVPLDGTANAPNPFSSGSPLDIINNPGVVTPSSPVVVGFTYTSQGQILRHFEQRESGAATGPAFGKKQRAHRFASLLVDTTTALSFGSDFTAKTMKPAKLSAIEDGQTAIAPNALFNGVYAGPLTADYTYNVNRLCWQISRPYPATIAAIGTDHETQG